MTPATPHTLGPWRWFANEKTGYVYLATPDRGRLIVMDFEMVEARDGSEQPEPRFARWPGYRAGAPRDKTGGIMVPATSWGRNEGDHNGEFDLAALHPDARLIAAAPELLAACERMKDFLVAGVGIMEREVEAGQRGVGPMLVELRARLVALDAVIAKATQRPPP